MSAIGGKADVRELPFGCLLIAISGHSSVPFNRSFLDPEKILLLSEQLFEPLHRSAKVVPIAIAEGLFRFC